MIPNFNDIQKAHQRILPFIHQTPVLQSRSINELFGAELFFKCENLQKVGAFKFRGASNAVWKLSPEDAKRGVATHSSGNHAAAIALAARMRGIRAQIVIPEDAPEIKKIAVAGYGAEISFCESTLQAREDTLQQILDQSGATFIHPYNHPDVIEGQGTAALELLQEVPDLDIVMTPVGGGGLLSGTAIVAKHLSPHIKVVAGEPLLANDAYLGFRSGVMHDALPPITIADGLRTSLGELSFQIIRSLVDDILLANEENIIRAMRSVWERMKIIIEPSSAVPLAALLENGNAYKNQRIGIILSGGNVDLSKLPF